MPQHSIVQSLVRSTSIASFLLYMYIIFMNPVIYLLWDLAYLCQNTILSHMVWSVVGIFHWGNRQ
jgi:hypothetical protein